MIKPLRFPEVNIYLLICQTMAGILDFQPLRFPEVNIYYAAAWSEHQLGRLSTTPVARSEYLQPNLHPSLAAMIISTTPVPRSEYLQSEK